MQAWTAWLSATTAGARCGALGALGLIRTRARTRVTGRQLRCESTAMQDRKVCAGRPEAGALGSREGLHVSSHQDGCAPPCTLRTGGPARGRRARRQADYAIASLDALPAVVAAVAGRVPVLMDGGVRRGTDIIKVRRGGADPVSPWTRPARACAWSQRRWRAQMCGRARLYSACYVRRRPSRLSAACRAA